MIWQVLTNILWVSDFYIIVSVRISEISLSIVLLMLVIELCNAVNVAYFDWKYANKLSSPGTTLAVVSGIRI